MPTEPFAFLKPTSSYIVEGQQIKVGVWHAVADCLFTDSSVCQFTACDDVVVREFMNTG